MSPHLGVDVDVVELDDLADALQDQQYGGQSWTFDPRTGEVGSWSRDEGEGEEEFDPALVVIEPYPSSVWYRDMVDFAEGLSDERAARRLFAPSTGEGRSAASRTSCTRSTRSWSASGRRSTTRERVGGPSSGCATRS